MPKNFLNKNSSARCQWGKHNSKVVLVRGCPLPVYHDVCSAIVGGCIDE